MGWSLEDIDSQTGRVALVTGSTDGIGREIALALAAKGAKVIVAGRNRERGGEVVSELRSAMTFEMLDLADLSKVREFASRVRNKFPRIDILVANAGISKPPKLQKSPDGFELQMAVNYFGHYALIAALLPALSAASARVVTMSSLAAARAKIDMGNLNGETGYSPMKFYGQSKLAMLLFSQELNRLSKLENWNITALSAHPGFARTNLGHSGPKIGASGGINWVGLSTTLTGHLLGQSAAAGALPALYAAVTPELAGGSYVGPSGLGQLRGSPEVIALPPSALSSPDATRLWRESEHLTGATWSRSLA